MTENRNSLVIAAEASLAATIAEREMALALLDRVVEPKNMREEKKVTQRKGGKHKARASE